MFLPDTTESFIFLRFEQLKQFNWADIGQVALLFIPVSLVTVCEHIGDHQNLGNIIGKDLLNEDEKEMLEDMLVVAINEAISKIDDETSKAMEGLTGGMKIPGMF